MKASELREKDIKALLGQAGELKKQYDVLKMQHRGSALENPKKIRAIRRDLARVLTVIGEKSKQGEK